MKLLSRIFGSKKYDPNKHDFIIPSQFEIGDKVKLSDRALARFNGTYRSRYSKMVYLVVGKDASILHGVMLKLHCGTTLWEDEAVKVDKDTPLCT